MPLASGTRLGPYEIVAAIGAGGMGEVYRATDPRMGRDVAIKISAEQFSDRFSREVHAVAALNHPNICHLYDVGPDYLVMELIEGPTLAERIKDGAIPLEESLNIAKQIADALEAAHEKGIVHRDLKPANIKVKADGTVKVLDFGLAKVAEPAEGGSRTEHSPTLTLDAATRVGVILGTAAYMPPEQARGKSVDKRADIWAFGVVLYEMLTGERLFEGETVSDTLIEVATREPDWGRVPAKVQRLLRRCLEKDPKRRLRDIGDMQLLLVAETDEDVRPLDVEHPGGPLHIKRWVWQVAAGVATLALAALALIHFREKPPAVEVVRFQIPAPEKSNFTSGAYVSPDGRRIAFQARGPDGRIVLWVHSLDSLESRPLSGTEGADAPMVWSPDSRFIAFGVQGKVKKVDASGGPPQTVCDLPAPWRGGGWSRDGVIVFGVLGKGLMRVSDAGGAASPLTTVDSSRQESSHSTPAFLPDGRHFVYHRNSTPENSGIYLGSLDAKPEQQSSKLLVASSSDAAYAPSPNPLLGDPGVGHLLFVREGSLMAQAFDARRLELAGEAVPIAEDLPEVGPAFFSVSTTGVLTYRTGSGSGYPALQLTWFDRAGKILGTVGEPGQYNTLALSPDGARVAFSRNDPQATGRGGGGQGNMDIWLYEFSRGAGTRLTFDPSRDWMAVWSPDGSRIIFSSDRGGASNLYQKVSSGAGNEEALLKSNETKYADDWSPDGRFLLYGLAHGSLWVLPLTGDDRKPRPYLETESASQARFSPDGRYVAYTSGESGQNEVYVRPFPTASGGKWMVSKGGGNQPHWRRDGKELFYISADSKMMSVEVAAAPGAFEAGAPKALFAAPIFGSGTTNTTRYDVTADGKKFLINSVPAETTPGVLSPITVVLNWEAGLRK